MIRNLYQEELAERSLVMEPSGEGEDWTFRWYIDPISHGLSKWQHYSVHVSEGYIAFHGLTLPRTEEEMAAMGQAIEFVKSRYERVGLSEESGD